MAGARRDQFSRARIIFGGFNGQDFFPVRPIPVLDAQGDGGANGFAVTYAGENLRVVFFDFLAAAASVAQLTAMQLVVDKLHIDGELCWEPGNESEQGLS